MAPLALRDRTTRWLWRLLPKRLLSAIIGGCAWCSVPRAIRRKVLGGFVRAYRIDMSEAEKALAEYCSFDDLFTRRLRPDARPIAAGLGVVVSPADGRVVEAGVVREGQVIIAKGSPFTLSELLADEELARRLEGGTFHVIYLSPQNYHRVHSPTGGAIAGWQHVPGALFPVNAPSVRREPRLFARNERLVSVVDGEAGECAVVMVAAVGVGHITLAYDADVGTHRAAFRKRAVHQRRFDPRPPVERGGELGVFHMGSTVVTIFPPGKVTLDPVVPGVEIRMGSRIGVC